MRIAVDGRAASILVESGAFEGVRRIAATLAEDICLVTGVRPEVISEEALQKGAAPARMILCATLGKSPLLEDLQDRGFLDGRQLSGKREVFGIRLLTSPFPGVEQALVIFGSDKRGTIYGMFTLSEYLGVTPLVFWGDAAPARRESIEVDSGIEMVSKEPSVRYRGFFINDEWPCFGTWVTSHFKDFNAEAYRYVFEFLLRMKGNYLWPAMWTASFPLDGPGSANEELADIYGVVMGYSHHEPCLRASEEWDKVRGENTRYGNEWNFYTNEQGLLNYWEDSLKRSGKYENIITIGMRGERDSSMLGDNATVEENVNLLKDIIRKQRGLIRKHINENLSEVPQMLALYKEVEEYFYGGGNVPGLKDWEELDGVICMLCDDNFGHMRTLPTEELRAHKGGFGMYYHFDYHGGPISYEWLDSTPLSKTWEQMCNAYEYGIRELWIVNVGDLKLHEVPLTYFMALAYDYERWGSRNFSSFRQFTEEWAERCFPRAASEIQAKAAKAFTDYIDLAHLHRPEALNEGTYHAFHYLEADRILEKALEAEALSREVMESLSPEERQGYYSMVHFSSSAFLNLLKMQLYAAKNQHYARQGRPAANRYAGLVRQCIEKDRELAGEFAAFQGGKWSGMELAPHIGFTRWNEDGCKYPFVCSVEPLQKPALGVSRADDGRMLVKNYGSPSVIEVRDFLSEGCDCVLLELSNNGIGRLEYRIEPERGEMPDWLEVDFPTGTIEDLKRIRLLCRREGLTERRCHTRLLVVSDDTVVAVEVWAESLNRERLPDGTWLPSGGVLTMAAEGFCSEKTATEGAFRVISGYGKYGSAVKVFPVTADFSETEESPELTYRFRIPEQGEYKVELLAAPTNSAVANRAIRMKLKKHTPRREGQQEEPRRNLLQNVQSAGVPEAARMEAGETEAAAPEAARTEAARMEAAETWRTVTLVTEDFRAGDYRDENWCRGVLDQIRTSALEMFFEEGLQELTIGALEAGAVLERICIYPAGKKMPESYLGPELSGQTH